MSPFTDSTPSGTSDPKGYPELITHLSQFFAEKSLTQRLNVEQMFILVDGVLPIETCLYHQVLPLFLEGSRLHLGMVNPADNTASEYVRRIVSYLNYSLVTRRIPSQALQAALSAYLKYSDQQSTGRQAASAAPSRSAPSRSAPSRSAPTSATPTPAAPTPAASSSPPEASPSAHSTAELHTFETDGRETFVLDTVVNTPGRPAPSGVLNSAPSSTSSAASERVDDAPVLPADELTCINPEDTKIISLSDTSVHPNPPQTPGRNVAAPDDTPENLPQDATALPLGPASSPAELEAALGLKQSASTEQPDSESASVRSSHPVTKASATIDSSANIHSHAARSGEATGIRDADGGDPGVPEQATIQPLTIETLQDQSPQELLRVLLTKAMDGGIGRLYFERQQQTGRVLWSQSGVLQSAVDNIPSAMFQSLINEFKRLTRMPLLPLQTTKQVELERFYKQNRILLRFRFIPGKYGEQATLQVLRGQALTFYQQQQVKRMGQDALGMAKQLQQKIAELQARIDAYPQLPVAEHLSLPDLKTMVVNLEQQIDTLETKTSV